MAQKNILVIGSGGREHAIARAFAKSKQVKTVYVAPGNPGMTLVERPGEWIECVPIDQLDFEALKSFVKTYDVTVTFVGPEVPLDKGIVDSFREENLAIVGPQKEAAQMETSKTFAKRIMEEAQVKTAAYRSFSPDQYPSAKSYLETTELPIVIKEDGLAAGKGVTIAETREVALNTIKTMMVDEQSSIVIEEFLTGKEFSYFFLVNQEAIIPIGTAQDYKRAYDGQTGPNTGGMGAYAPVDWGDETLKQQVMTEVMRPLSQQLVKGGIPYTGVLYAGMMLTPKGLRVIEFNARLGDPETQVLLPLIEQDFYDIISAHLSKKEIEVTLKKESSIGVVIAAKGYPRAYSKGMRITEIPNETLEHTLFSGVDVDQNKHIITTGGRIAMVTATGRNLETCRQEVYDRVKTVEIPNTFYRSDIGQL
ncbi:phosphoribosylamine--glycine ligase [Bavariicoccus seileri]|uniref:phosphoribosylamine--glycine ligase n=1 Tax=Bavariicoccus seileri TaxID=549685 RepID=UPI0003B5217C|nr:phosphoribosylamine--glycine ligase [Bavariicoccus seileri]